jgi:ribose-phosphate pyrophosphokinase
MCGKQENIDEVVKKIVNSPLIIQRIATKLVEDRLELVAIRDDSQLAKDIAGYLDKELVPVDWSFYDDGEDKPRIEKNLNQKDVFVIADLEPARLLLSEGLVRTQLLIEALKETCKVNQVGVVSPIHPYQAQDKTHARREPKSARWIARMWQDLLGVKHVICVELHSEQIESLYKSMDNLHAAPIMAHYVQENYLNGASHVVGVLSDPSAGHIVDEFLNNFDKEMRLRTTADKIRDRETKYKTDTYCLVGDPVKGQVCTMLDDMVRSGTTMFGASGLLQSQQAASIIAAAAHGYGFKSEGYGLFETALPNSPIKELVVFNTNPLFLPYVMKHESLQRKVTVLDIAPYIGRGLIAYQTGDTVKDMIKNTKDIGSLYNILHKATDTL